MTKYENKTDVKANYGKYIYFVARESPTSKYYSLYGKTKKNMSTTPKKKLYIRKLLHEKDYQKGYLYHVGKYTKNGQDFLVVRNSKMKQHTSLRKTTKLSKSKKL